MDEIQNQEPLSRWQKFWYAIAILDLPAERKTEVAQKMVDYSYADSLYWFQFVLSSVIATMGLLINSSPVVIGAMLISPILQPIQSFAFAVNSGHKTMYVRSLNNLFLSVVVCIAVSALITWIVPFSSLTTQIISRTTPTLVDLFIALAGGVIAMLALGYNRLSDTLAGVAMAASLLPPLCVVGIGLSFVRRDVAEGSMMLFLANLVALVLVGLFIFYLFGFFPTDNKSKHLSFSRLFLVLVTVILISVPLWTSMHAIAQDYKITQTIKSITHDYISQLHPQVTITTTTYEERQGTLRVTLGLQSPEGVRFAAEDTTLLNKKLLVALGQSVELDIQILYVAGAYKKNTVKPISDKEVSIREHFAAVFSDSTLQAVSVDEQEDSIYIALSFVTPMDADMVGKYILAWKNNLVKYWKVPVVFTVEVSYIDIISL